MITSDVKTEEQEEVVNIISDIIEQYCPNVNQAKTTG
jgi:hypothetical protein